MTDVLCDCNCRYSSPDGRCMLECISMDNYGRCAEFEEAERRKLDETTNR